MNRTTESLQTLFQQSRDRQERKRLQLQKQREKKKQERITNYRNLCKQADELLRKALQEEKKKLMDKLSTLNPKPSQNQNKQPQMTISRTSFYHTRYVERHPAEDDLYHTRQELEQAEPNIIDWKLWDELVNLTRRQLDI